MALSSVSVDPTEAAAELHHGGQVYYFCLAACKEAFDREPERYLRRAA